MSKLSKFSSVVPPEISYIFLFSSLPYSFLRSVRICVLKHKPSYLRLLTPISHHEYPWQHKQPVIMTYAAARVSGEKSRTRCQYASTPTPCIYTKAKTCPKYHHKLSLVKSKCLKYNNFGCIADLSVLCGTKLPSFARRCANSVGWYTIMPLKSHINRIRFIQ